MKYRRTIMALVAFGAAATMTTSAPAQRDPDCPYSSGGCYTIGVSKPLTPEEQREQDERNRLNRLKQEAHNRAVEAEVLRLGEHRRAEAERLVTLRENADAARNRNQGVAAAAAAARPAEPLNRLCPLPAGTFQTSGGGKTIADARADIMRQMKNACTSTGYPLGPPGTVLLPMQCDPPRTMKFEKGSLTTTATCYARYSCPPRQGKCPPGPAKAGKAIAQ